MKFAPVPTRGAAGSLGELAVALTPDPRLNDHRRRALLPVPALRCARYRVPTLPVPALRCPPPLGWVRLGSFGAGTLPARAKEPKVPLLGSLRVWQCLF